MQRLIPNLNKKSFISVICACFIGALPLVSQGQHTDEQETPDLLLHETQREDVQEFGESNIVIQTGGKKVDEQITPDQLEESLADNKKITEKSVVLKTSSNDSKKDKNNKKHVKKKKKNYMMTKINLQRTHFLTLLIKLELCNEIT